MVLSVAAKSEEVTSALSGRGPSTLQRFYVVDRPRSPAVRAPAQGVATGSHLHRNIHVYEGASESFEIIPIQIPKGEEY